VVDLGTWKSSNAVHIRAKSFSGSFFLDGKTVYVEISAIPSEGFSKSQRLLINADGTVVERLRAEKPKEPTFHFRALDNGRLLGDEYNDGTLALIQALLPDYTTTLRVPFRVVPEREAWTTQCDPIVSDDRRSIVYSFDRWIVCRRVDDLQLVWKHQIEAPLRPWQVAISATGSRVAAAVVDTAYITHQRNFYVGIFDGRDGSPLAQLPLNGFDGIGISPDGDFVAVSQRHLDHRIVQPAVHVYDIASGKEVAALGHDSLSVERATLFGSLRIAFSSDGKYVITSGIDTRIWEI
jgi:hypothetical protein